MKSIIIFISFLLTVSALKTPEKENVIGSLLTNFLQSHPKIPLLDSFSFVSWALGNIGMTVSNDILNLGKEVETNELLPGDLLFFRINSVEIDHVAIYIGDDKISHIPKPGEPISEEFLYSNIWTNSFVLAKRFTDTEVILYILDRMHISEVHQSSFITYVIKTGYKNEDFGFLRFYTQDVSERQLLLSVNEKGEYINGNKDKNSQMPLNLIKSGIIPSSMTYKRPLIKKPSVEFITIHDAGDNKATAELLMKEVTTSSRPVSWHFSVDDKEAYQHVPLDEVARHAGDNIRYFHLTDTGVEYTKDNPTLEFNTEDHHLYINGIKTELLAPTTEAGEYMHEITPAGLYTEKGTNGNYYINLYYANESFNKVSNGGGNGSSIGIETCIYNGVNYSKVMRKTANLVAHLLNVYKLSTRRVLQHRNFSGKMCPQSMIRADKKSPFAYEQFMELVEIEALILKSLPNAKFTYQSNNPDILDDNGFLLKYVTEPTEISYTVIVEFNKEYVRKTFHTVIYPKEE